MKILLYKLHRKVIWRILQISLIIWYDYIIVRERRSGLTIVPIILEGGKDRERKISATVQLNRTFWKPYAR